MTSEMDEEPVSKQVNAGNAQAPAPKAAGKHNYMKNLLRTGSRKVTSGSQRLGKMIRSGSVRHRDQSSNSGYEAVPQTPKTPQQEYQDRFDITCPESLAELFEALEQGRHPEILRMSIDHKLQRTPFPANHDRSSAHGVLSAMLEALKERVESGNLDGIQGQTLEKLGREYDWVAFT